MSYILDALKKAAEQRDAQAPAMRRLFSPAPEITDSPRWRMAVVGGGAAVAGAVIAVWVLWPATPVVTEKLEAATARVQPETPAPVQPVEPPPPPAPPIVRTTPKPAAPVGATAAKRATPPPAARVETRPPAAEPAPVETRRPAAELAPVETRRPTTEPAPVRPLPTPLTTPPPAIASVRPGPVPAAIPPPAATPAPRAEGGGQMRLEVIVYSDERARRLAFINGRKYVEGDTLLDGSKIQEIQPNAVVIIDDGRRVVLRP